MNPRAWSIPILVLAILSVAAMSYGMQSWTSGGWDRGVHFTISVIILVLGVTLAER